MWIFLQIVLAVILVLLLAALMGWWWFRRWLRRKLGSYQGMAQLLDPRYARPARLQFEMAADAPGDRAIALWGEFQELGFVTLGDLGDRGGAFQTLRAGWHAGSKQALAIIEAGAERAPDFVVFVLTRENRLLALSTGPEAALRHPNLDWQVAPGTRPQDAVRQLGAMVSAALTRDAASGSQPLALDSASGSQPHLRELDLRMFQAIFERAYAARMDAELAQPPQLAWFSQHALELGVPASPEVIELAFENCYGQWLEQLKDAALDHYRRASKIDAVRWEQVKDDIHFVHAGLRPADLKSLLAEDALGEQLFDQFAAQDFTGQALYEKVSARLSVPQRRQLLGKVERPLPGALYVLASKLDGAPASSVPVGASPARSHAYAATDVNGNEVHGMVLAGDARDAKRQLSALGLTETRILAEPMPLTVEFEGALDPQVAAAAARAARESLGMSLLRMLYGCIWIWGPPAALLTWTLVDGAPFSVGDWFIFAYAGLALLVMVVLVAPMLLYMEAQRAWIHGRWTTAELCLSLLRPLARFSGIGRHGLLTERCKVLASRGQSEAALALLRTERAAMTPEQYDFAMVQVQGAIGDFPQVIAAMRRLLKLDPHKDIYRLDLAMALVRYERATEEAENLLGQLRVENLSELVLAGYHYLRGLIATERGQHAQAVRHFGSALEQTLQFRSNPALHGLRAEINGYRALALKHSGESARANTLWSEALPILKLHASGRALIGLYERG